MSVINLALVTAPLITMKREGAPNLDEVRVMAGDVISIDELHSFQRVLDVDGPLVTVRPYPNEEESKAEDERLERIFAEIRAKQPPSTHQAAPAAASSE